MRDELSHNVFLMLQECNKFREHQSRELLIELLEQQLAERKKLVAELQTDIARAEELLPDELKKQDTTTTAVQTEEDDTANVKAEPMEE